MFRIHRERKNMKKRTVVVVGVVLVLGLVLIFAAISGHSAEEMPLTKFKKIPNALVKGQWDHCTKAEYTRKVSLKKS